MIPHAQGRLGAATVLEAAQSGSAALKECLALGLAEAHQLLEANEQANWLFSPPRVQLWGPVNAGKSSLLNALCGEELAAVADEPGLTRDVIEGRFEHEGFVVRVFDAPGQMDGAAGVDQAAFQLAELWKARADLVICLEPRPPRGAQVSKLAGPTQWSVPARIDEWDANAHGGVSARIPETVRALKGRIVDHFIGKLMAMPPTRRFALPVNLRADLRGWLEGALSAEAILEQWLRQ
jgi:hypothetical protein